MARPTRFCILLSMPIILGACDDGDDTPRYVRSCAINCERAHACLSSVDVEACVDACEEDLENVGPHLRSEYFAGLDACVAALSCSELALASITNTCPAESRVKLGATASATRLCDAVSESLQMCVGFSVGTTLCLDRAKIFDDRSLNRAAFCADEPCDRAASCIVDALGMSLFGG